MPREITASVMSPLPPTSLTVINKSFSGVVPPRLVPKILIVSPIS